MTQLPDGRTRLVISGYQAIQPRWLKGFFYSWVFPPVVWIMQARMLAVLKRNVERAAARQARMVPTGPLVAAAHDPDARQAVGETRVETRQTAR